MPVSHVWKRRASILLSRSLRCSSCAIPRTIPTLKKRPLLVRPRQLRMKGGIVAMLYAILALKEIGAQLKYKIGLTLVPDEETGGEGGTAWLAQPGLLGRGGVGMLTAEPTSSVVWNAHRGAISLRVRVFGKAAHVGIQHQGANAFA